MLVLERKTDFIGEIRSQWCKWLHGLLQVIKKPFKKKRKIIGSNTLVVQLQIG
jgi:hypothetical protein